MTDLRGITLPHYKASFAARLPVGGVMQMRVPVKPQLGPEAEWVPWEGDGTWRANGLIGDIPRDWLSKILYAPHKLGDVVFGKETLICTDKGMRYAADDSPVELPDDFDRKCVHERWPAIMMPKYARRLYFRVRSVRVERLQDISEADAAAEGASPEFEIDIGTFIHGKVSDLDRASTHKLGFKHRWQEQHHKRHPWQSNPWVFVNELERTDRP